MKKTALITGASQGIGYELSKVFAKNGYQIVIVSRSTERLEAISDEIKKHYSIQAVVISKDLSEATAPQELYDETVSRGISIDVLVNNAGIGAYGKFTETTTEKQKKLIQLNIASLTLLCKMFAADMAKKGSGKILNVASIAAFQAGPLLSTYFASKAYVLMFSEALNNELNSSISLLI